MAESISKGLADLNRADLSALIKRLAAARAEAEKSLASSAARSTTTPAGLDLAELERARRTAAPN